MSKYNLHKSSNIKNNIKYSLFTLSYLFIIITCIILLYALYGPNGVNNGKSQGQGLLSASNNSASKNDIQLLNNKLDSIFGDIKTNFGSVNNKLDNDFGDVNSNFGGINDKLDSNFKGMNTNFDDINSKLDLNFKNVNYKLGLNLYNFQSTYLQLQNVNGCLMYDTDVNKYWFNMCPYSKNFKLITSGRGGTICKIYDIFNDGFLSIDSSSYTVIFTPTSNMNNSTNMSIFNMIMFKDSSGNLSGTLQEQSTGRYIGINKNISLELKLLGPHDMSDAAIFFINVIL